MTLTVATAAESTNDHSGAVKHRSKCHGRLARVGQKTEIQKNRGGWKKYIRLADIFLKKCRRGK